MKLRVVPVLAAAMILTAMVALAGYAFQVRAASAATPKLVRNTAGLQAALTTARSGDRIQLAAGQYDAVRIQGVKFAGDVTIASADPANRARVAGIEVVNASGLKFENLELTVNERNAIAFNVGGRSDRIVLDRAVIHDSVKQNRSGVLIRDSSDVTVKNCELFDVGTALRIIGSRNVTVAGSRFHDIRGDGIQGTNSSFVTLTRNNFTNFYPKPGDHPDAMQFFTLNAKGPATDLTFTDNVFVRGAGSPVQGIFLGNEIALPYQRVVITGNTFIGAMYNGIAVDVADDVTIANNVVQAYSDMGSWILVGRSANAKVSDNRATDYVYKGENKHLSDKGNKRMKAAKVGDVSALAGRAGH